MSDNKTIAFAMAKEVIINRRNSSSLEHRGKENDTAYWLEIYHECLHGLEQSEQSGTPSNTVELASNNW